GVVYAAAWGAAPMEIFSTNPTVPGSRTLGLSGTDLLAVSPTGELAVLQALDPRFLLTVRGTLGHVPLAGGSPRPVAEAVEWADWAPDGSAIAVVRAVGGQQRLIYRAPGGVTLHDISADGSVLLTRDEQRVGMMGLAPGAARERELSWRDWSLPMDLTPDGNTVLFDEQGLEGGSTYTVAM